MLTSTSSGSSSKNAGIEARRALVRRVVESSTFGKSERLASFLVCICDLTLNGRASEINEQKIGTTVFGRAPDYDSSIDGIVRPQASRLRQRLDLYFSGEGVNEPVRISLPRGSYVPVFEPNAGQVCKVESSSILSVAPPQLSLPEATKRVPWILQNAKLPWLLVAILLVALLLIGSRSLERSSTGRATPPISNPFWGLLFHSNQRTVVVPSDTGLVMWQSAAGENVDLERYVSGSYRAKGEMHTGQVNPADLASRRYTSIVDLGIVKHLTQIADTQNGELALSYARDVHIDDLKEANVVLIGAAVANPWVELFEPRMNFIFADAHIRQYSVVNRAPTGNEPARWTSNYDDPQHRVYGVVGFVPNLDATANVLILEGTSMAGTQCAWDFVADDSTFLPFIKRISRPDGSIPHFQLVLDSTNLTGSAIRRNILAYRVMD